MEDNRHDEEVQKEALWGAWTVKMEKDEREKQCEELEAGVAEGRTQEFQSSNCRQENITAGGRFNGRFTRQTGTAQIWR